MLISRDLWWPVYLLEVGSVGLHPTKNKASVSPLLWEICRLCSKLISANSGLINLNLRLIALQLPTTIWDFQC